MKFLKELFNTDRVAIVRENEKIRLSKKNLEYEFQEYKDNTQELKDKYIALLEEKSKGFDMYIHYEEECIKLADERRELKKEKASLEEKLNSKDEVISQQEKTIARLEKKITKPNEKK